MTKPSETRGQFFQLRSSGMTLAKLKIAYNMAVNLEKGVEREIQSCQAFRMEELLEKYRMTKEKRKFFCERLMAIQV